MSRPPIGQQLVLHSIDVLPQESWQRQQRVPPSMSPKEIKVQTFEDSHDSIRKFMFSYPEILKIERVIVSSSLYTLFPHI